MASSRISGRDPRVGEAVILSVGDELILGQTVDTNAAWLSARLAEAGVATRHRLTLPDDQAGLADAVRRAAREARWIILTGGLGPTRDDLTREALAEACGAPLEMRPEALARIEEFFRARGRVMTASNRKQALAPRGAALLENPVGTAPGLRLALGRAVILAFPGVPAEMRVMVERHLLPCLRQAAGQVLLTRTLNTFGLGESAVGEALGALMRRDRNPRVGTTVSGGVVSVRIRSAAPTSARARAALARTAREARRRLGGAVFGEDDTTLAETVGALLAARRRTVATAESCTGGLVAALLTAVAGASAWFRGGWVAYANAFKADALGVPARLLARHGAVSRPAACAMAAGALRRAGTHYALALTGVAGPGGGSADKPVGGVWIALAARRRGARPRVTAERFLFPGDRARVRERAAKTALNLLRLELGAPPGR